MQQIIKKRMVIGLSNIHFSEGVCEGYALGNNPQEKLKKGKAHKASSPLDLIYNDIMGPLTHPSIRNARYMLTFLDDYSRYIWVFFLKKNSEVFENLKELKEPFKTQSKRNINSLHTDNGGKYVNRDVHNIFLKVGIK
jgi:transposase InsO family protein